MTQIEILSLYLPYDLQLLENCDHWFDPIPDRIVTMTGLLDTDLKLPQQYDNEPIECFSYFIQGGSEKQPVMIILSISSMKGKGLCLSQALGNYPV